MFPVGPKSPPSLLLAQGNSVGKSLVEEDLVPAASRILEKAKKLGCRLHLPVDFKYAYSHKSIESEGICSAKRIPENALVLDIGPDTVIKFVTILAQARTVVWNGPMGLFETPAFSEGSLYVCRAITIVGGGDTDAVVHLLHLAEKFSFISTGGGSFLQFLEGKEMPAFKALKECLKS